ncbi:plasmid replication initiator RepA [Lonsdalea quercina]|uniref:plasmid replication initiator RepA n=1 Tax=Lonsdalea quercina TaxID=71657 RepID=UPI0039772225
MSENISLPLRPGRPKNPNPEFVPPKGKETLTFNQKLMDAARGFTTTFSFAIHVAFARQKGLRKRTPPRARLQAIEALLQGLCFHYDPLANRVNVTMTNLAIECGLATETAHDTHTNVSISRVTRALKALHDMGLITYKTEFCATLGCNFPSDISFLPDFFRALDISQRAVEGACRSRHAYKNMKRKEQGLPELTLDEHIAAAWGAMRSRFYEYRLKRKKHGERRAKALRDAQRSRSDIQILVRRELTKEIAAGLFPIDRTAADAEIERRVKQRMIQSRGNFTRLVA